MTAIRRVRRIGSLIAVLLVACSTPVAQPALAPAAPVVPAPVAVPTAAPAVVAPLARVPIAPAAVPETTPTPSPAAAARASTPEPAATAIATPQPVVVASPVIATATPAPATAAPAPANTTVNATLVDIAIKLDRAFAPAGKVTFQIKNAGTVMHQLVVLKTDIPQGSIPASTTQPGTVTQPGFITQSQDIQPGATATLSLNLAAGKYVLMCNQPAHYLIGMHVGFKID